ncbi:MAG: deoxyguanosinetriphosphate triphosphohydrolase [Lachnospiraceae bacterium]|nr:deoxyguanosinetriphosphate triphosphohydrolase [Lachnospiraceae bacterium]
MEWNQLLSGERIRAYNHKNEKDYRSEFEKDYHRIIVSASFRRLQDKTQVFPLDKSDFIRTRLTHSMEVSSIGKSFGKAVYHRVKEYHPEAVIEEIQAVEIGDVLLSAGLIHDIGNPPFGHFGENVIREWFGNHLIKDGLTYKGKPVVDYLNSQMKADFLNFEGNAQALRVVTKLHSLVDAKGMNLTKAILNTIIKYPVSSLGIDAKSGDIKTKKMGYFYAERDVFRAITEGTGAKGNRYPLVYLLEASDDIAYKTADVEDGFKKGRISFTKLKHELECNKYTEHKKEKGYLFLAKAIEDLEIKYQKGVKRNYHNPEVYAVQNWVIGVQSMLIEAAVSSFSKNYYKIMEGKYTKDLFEDTKAYYLAKVLGDIAYEQVFQSKEILKLEAASYRIITFLLEHFVDAALVYDTDEPKTQLQAKLMDLVSDTYKYIYHVYSEGKPEGEKVYLRLLLVTDFISGMTDHYAKTLYQELNGIY